MHHDVDSRIATFFNHFNGVITRLKGYVLGPEDKLLKKNILVSVLDAVSIVTSKTGDGNRKRFTNTVSIFGDWPAHSRVSAPHVNYLLQLLRRDPCYDEARGTIAAILHRNSDGRFVPLSEDPSLEEIVKVWPVPSDKKVLGKLRLTSFTHLNLFYEHRNSLVHELREPGYGMEFHDNHLEPFYHGMTTVNDNGEPASSTLELVYPLHFYFSMTERVLTNLVRHLRKHGIDPYERFRFGSSWVGDLNQPQHADTDSSGGSL